MLVHAFRLVFTFALMLKALKMFSLLACINHPFSCFTTYHSQAPTKIVASLNHQVIFIIWYFSVVW